MSIRNVGIVYRKELTEAIRDRRTVISTILVPLLLFPVLSVGFGSLAVVLVGKAKEEVPKVMLRGGEDSPAVVEGLKKLDKIEIVPETPGWKDQIINKEIRAAVESYAWTGVYPEIHNFCASDLSASAPSAALTEAMPSSISALARG